MAFSVEFFKYLKKIRILKKNVDEKSLILKNYDIKKKNFLSTFPKKIQPILFSRLASYGLALPVEF